MSRTSTYELPRKPAQLSRGQYVLPRKQTEAPKRKSIVTPSSRPTAVVSAGPNPQTISVSLPKILPEIVAAKPEKLMLALLIAAHNEELVIAKTIRSAIDSGMKPEDIYVVDDNSSDETSNIARELIPRSNVHRVQRSGKGLALTKATKKFGLSKRYEWIHIADADGAFSPDYFAVFRENLDPSYAAATGYIRSLPGRNVSQYRVFEYTIGMELHRRFQAMFNVIPIIPGPTSCFRSDVLAKVDFANKSLTEDFDVTLQIHRQKLGKIQFIPKAIAYTQDPGTVKDFSKQIMRWNRGVMQGVTRHHIGRKMSAIDLYISYQILQNILLFVNYFVWVPFLMMKYQSVNVLASVFVYDVLTTFAIALLVAIRSKRWDIISAFPIVYGLRWVTLAVFVRSFVEVMILRKFRISDGTWDNGASRRYVMPA